MATNETKNVSEPKNNNVESIKLDKFKAVVNRDNSNFTKFEQRMVAATKSRKK